MWVWSLRSKKLLPRSRNRHRVDRMACLQGLGLCARDAMLKLCDDLQLSALLLCGNPPKEICDAITMMCGDAPLLLCLL
ncbi:hypothetical protein OV079_22935 [Nannocystis pusilla]|uniref:Uncharacterized protein n=1 Tax=Nannocystis pusilla TaxID=889268 RepID=A0A9X3EQC2_9BACT|nr:hypothetical protein [Nannocystis pusilla]MCY1008359.1 hypothetical protein [Nannocystis pusilla]